MHVCASNKKTKYAFLSREELFDPSFSLDDTTKKTALKVADWRPFENSSSHLSHYLVFRGLVLVIFPFLASSLLKNFFDKDEVWNSASHHDKIGR